MPLLRPTVAIEAHEAPAFLRRVSLSLPLMAILAGAGLRLYRAIVLEFGWSASWLWIAGTFMGGAFFLFLMATMHLGNYSVRAWAWRAPLFALVESATEMAVSLSLTLFGVERIGSIPATIADWPSTSMKILFYRGLGITLFAVILALVSTVVRLMMIPSKPEHP